MKVRRSSRFAIILLLACAFVVVGASSAFATSSTLPLKFTAAGKTFNTPASLVSTPTSSVDTTEVNNWVHALAVQVNSSPHNAVLKLNKKKKRLDFTAARVGYTLNQPAAAQLIMAEVASYISTPTAGTWALPTDVAKAKITKFGKTILVVQSRRKIYLYDNNKVIKTYRCAVGQKGWPTPNGTFHIGKKIKNPSWVNGYASWSKNMPSYIGPGPNNPLGTRAMYVYSGTSGGHDTGVRFHGVPSDENSSIGHAASHGCLRMHRKDVEKFYPLVPLGTIVYIIP